MSVAGLIAVLLAPAALASGGTGEYPLDWRGRGEVLAYHSCGCADGCWEAEVRPARGRKVLARLRCDCEKLYFYRPGHGPERVVAASCDAINEHDGKAELIRREMERLLRRRK